MHTPGAEVSGFICVLIIQMTFIVLFGIFVRYDDALLPDTVDANADVLEAIERERGVSYPRKCSASVPRPRVFSSSVHGESGTALLKASDRMGPSFVFLVPKIFLEQTESRCLLQTWCPPVRSFRISLMNASIKRVRVNDVSARK